MNVFKTYFKVLKKQMVSILLYGVMFLGITLVLNLTVFRENSNTFAIKKVPITVINEEKDSEFVRGLLSYLEKYVTFEKIEGDEARRDALISRKVEYILIIPEGFTDAFLQNIDRKLIKETVPNSVNAASVDTAINNYLNLAKVYRKHNPGMDITKLNSYISSNLDTDTKVNLDVKQKKDTITAYEFNSFYYNYLGYILITCYIIGVSTVMLSFHGIDIRRRHTASPITNKKINFQLILANLIFVTGYLIIFIAAGFFLNPIRRLDTNVLLMWFNAFLFSVTVLSISYLIGITVKGKNAVQALSTMLSLSLSFISGMFVPQEFLGDPVIRVASFTPSYWYVKTNNTITEMAKFSQSGLAEIFGYMAIQVGFAIAIICIALVVSKRKRQLAN